MERQRKQEALEAEQERKRHGFDMFANMAGVGSVGALTLAVLNKINVLTLRNYR